MTCGPAGRGGARKERDLRRLTGILLAALLLDAGCGLRVTNERPPYADLDTAEKLAVQRVLRELTSLNSSVARYSSFDLSPIVDREQIDVSYEGMLFVSNLGDNVVHVAVWENLTEAQQERVAAWFKSPNARAAADTYGKLFYEFMATAQGVKQFMFNALGAPWVFANRTLFNIERDSIRTALAHYADVGRKAEMWGFLDRTCAPVIQQYAADYAGTFPDIKRAKEYMNDHFTEMADPDDPTGYMYFICEWIALGEATGPLAEELQWLLELPL